MFLSVEAWPRARCLALVAVLGGAGLPAAAQEAAPRAPERHGLFVGCSEYPYLREALGERYERELALRGPANDAELVRATLERVLGLPASRARVLAGWGEEVRSRPTRANILGELERLAREARPGDQVVVYLAGHGSQQRVQRLKAEEEPDGLEEIFLAADARPAQQDQGFVPSSIKDDELGEAVRKIRDAGAEVWLIVDSCHSGTLLRGGAEGGVRLRGIDPALLGVSSALRGGRDAVPAGKSWIDGSESARIAALYGATSYGRAPEMDLPYRSADAKSHGLFTYLLCQELERTAGRASYRELADRIIAAYQAFPCVITVPTAEGDLEREIASGEALAAPLVCTRRSDVLFLNQGRLAGLEPGVMVELYELADGAERSAGRVEITQADLFESRARLVSGALAGSTGPWRARTEARPLGDYRLALACVHPDGSPASAGELPQVLRERLEAEAQRFPLLPREQADWWIVIGAGGRLWLRPGPREGGSDLFGASTMTGERCFEALLGIQTARNLRRFAGSSFTGEWQGDLDVWTEHRGAAERGWRRLAPDALLHPGDEIRVRLQKKSDAIYDVNVLYLDANHGLQHLFPVGGSTPRLEAGARETLELTGEMTITDDALGLEHVLVFATPRSPASPTIDLRGLEQGGRLRGASSDPFEDLIRDVMRGDTLRGEPLRVSGTRNTQSQLSTLRTAWGPIRPPAWPARTAVLERALGAPGMPGTPVEGAAPAFPDPWQVGARAALEKSRKERGELDLLLLGTAEVEAVLLDCDGGAPATDPASLVRERSFDAEAAFLFGGRSFAYYDRDDDGVFDLVLVDATGDGVAEERWALEERSWIHDAGVALPWLSQGHLRVPPDRKVEISARFQALQRSP